GEALGEAPIRSLVAKGFSQKEGNDYHEVFSPMVKYKIIRVLLAMVGTFNLELEHLDVKTAFLHGNLEERIYMSQPEGFNNSRRDYFDNCVYSKRVSVDSYVYLLLSLVAKGFSQKEGNDYHEVFSPMVKHKIIRVLLAMVGTFNLELEHLDVKTAFLHAKNMVVINDLKVLLKSEFEMKDLGATKKILGMEIWHDRKAGRLCVSQEKYIEKVLQAFFVDRSKPISTPLAAHFKFDRSTIPGTVKEVKYMKTVPYSSAVGSLMYDMACTRPDLAHAVSVVSRFMANPGKAHWKAVK
nr:retrovirus-related Pol polyprotein from transposon TNT 1-94 [Tanacetum cinerariifolium]